MLMILKEFFTFFFVFGAILNHDSAALPAAPRAALCALLIWVAWLIARWRPGDEE